MRNKTAIGTICLLLATAVQAATPIYPPSTNGNNTFFGNNEFKGTLTQNGVAVRTNATLPYSSVTGSPDVVTNNQPNVTVGTLVAGTNYVDRIEGTNLSWLTIAAGGVNLTLNSGTVQADSGGFSGYGGNLTGITSNSFDVGTKAQLALAQPGIDVAAGSGITVTTNSNLRTVSQTTPAIASMNGIGTNATLRINGVMPPQLAITNELAVNSSVSATAWRTTNTLAVVATGIGVTSPTDEGSYYYPIFIRDWTNGFEFSWLHNPYHDVSSWVQNSTNHYEYHPEEQITSAGGVAFSAGYNLGTYSYTNWNRTRRVWQWGISGLGQPYIYHLSGEVANSVDPAHRSAMFPEFWKCKWFYATNSLYKWAGSLDLSSEDTPKLPALMARGYGTDGSMAWTWFDNLEYSLNTTTGNFLNEETATKRMQVIAGPSGGMNVLGTVNVTGTVVATNFSGNGSSLSNVPSVFPNACWSCSTNTTFANVTNTITLNTVEHNSADSGLYLDNTAWWTSGVGSRIWVTNTGDYLITFSAVWSKTGATAENGDLWIRKNSVDIPRTMTLMSIQNSSTNVMTVNFIVPVTDVCYFDFQGASPGGNGQLQAMPAISSPFNRPACPSIIVTFNKISD